MRPGERAVVAVAVVAALGVALLALWELGGVRGTAYAAAAKAESKSESYGDEGLRVTGTAVVRAAPDVAIVRLGYESRALKARPARVDNDRVMKKVLEALESGGVARKDIQTVEYRLFPIWENWPVPTTRALVWHVLHMVEVRVRAVDTVADVIDAASAAGADKMENVRFWVDDLHQLRGQAREMAAKVGREKAEQLAKLMGAKLGKVTAIHDVIARYGWYDGRRTQFMAQSIREEPMEVEPDSVVRGGQVVVEATEELVFSLE